MKLQIDRDADALYLRFDESTIAESEEVEPDIIFDYDHNDRVVGIEVLHLSSRGSGLDLTKLIVEGIQTTS